MVCLGNGRALIQELTRATLNNVVKRVRRNDPSLTAVVWGMADGFDTCTHVTDEVLIELAHALAPPPDHSSMRKLLRSGSGPTGGTGADTL